MVALYNLGKPPLLVLSTNIHTRCCTFQLMGMKSLEGAKTKAFNCIWIQHKVITTQRCFSELSLIMWRIFEKHLQDIKPFSGASETPVFWPVSAVCSLICVPPLPPQIHIFVQHQLLTFSSISETQLIIMKSVPINHQVNFGVLHTFYFMLLKQFLLLTTTLNDCFIM